MIDSHPLKLHDWSKEEEFFKKKVLLPKKKDSWRGKRYWASNIECPFPSSPGTQRTHLQEMKAELPLCVYYSSG